MSTTQKFADKVNHLISKNNDASKGFKQAAEKTEHRLLKSFLTKQSIKREKFANDLSAALRTYDPAYNTNQEGSLAGGIHRGWVDMKAAFTKDTDDAILEECLRGDRASLDEYHEVLSSASGIPQSVTELIQEQHTDIHSAVHSINRLEDLA